MRKASASLAFRRAVTARAARASLVKGVSAITIRYAAEESRDNVKSLTMQGTVYAANWQHTDRMIIFTVEA